jgi:hypothetical protein
MSKIEEAIATIEKVNIVADLIEDEAEADLTTDVDVVGPVDNARGALLLIDGVKEPAGFAVTTEAGAELVATPTAAGV